LKKKTFSLQNWLDPAKEIKKQIRSKFVTVCVFYFRGSGKLSFWCQNLHRKVSPSRLLSVASALGSKGPCCWVAPAPGAQQPQPLVLAHRVGGQAGWGHGPLLDTCPRESATKRIPQPPFMSRPESLSREFPVSFKYFTP